MSEPASLSESDLRAAMRDPRYWNPNHPDRAAYNRWVADGWQALGQQDAAGGGQHAVSVRSYQRSRNGRQEQVSGYVQMRDRAEHHTPNPSGQEGAQSPAPTAPSGPRPAVIFIGGAGDSWLNGPVGRTVNGHPEHPDREAMRRLYPNADIQYFPNDNQRAIQDYIDQLPAGTPVTLVGHSWGGHRAAILAAAAAREGRSFERVVTVDPVGWRLPSAFYPQVRAGTREWINIQATGGGSIEPSNIIAFLGNRYGDAATQAADIGLRVPTAHANFSRMLDARGPDGRSIRQRIFGTSR